MTGGASVGERDHAKAMFKPLGMQLLFPGVAIKPGKPVWLGRVGETLVMGLPGNPSSAMVTARLLLAPLVAAMLGQTIPAPLEWINLPLGAPLPATGDRETFLRARLVDGRSDPARQPGFGRAAGAWRRPGGWCVVRPGRGALAAGDMVAALAF